MGFENRVTRMLGVEYPIRRRVRSQMIVAAPDKVYFLTCTVEDEEQELAEYNGRVSRQRKCAISKRPSVYPDSSRSAAVPRAFVPLTSE